MAGELSKILGHIDTINELDLDGVPPTSHVVEVANALRPDEARPSLDREVALANAPSRTDEGFLVPSPQAGG
jgi:aspartyl-tRNA(Asn)/glutamyl-tRNA(Gln) amidotransferase subunit C